MSRRSDSKPLITASTWTSAAVPIHTPPIGTVVKNVKNARRQPKNIASPASTAPMMLTTLSTCSAMIC